MKSLKDLALTFCMTGVILLIFKGLIAIFVPEGSDWFQFVHDAALLWIGYIYASVWAYLSNN